MSMPEHLQVQVLEESPSTIYLVLPQSVARTRVELSDAELEGGGESALNVECNVVCEGCWAGPYMEATWAL